LNGFKTGFKEDRAWEEVEKEEEEELWEGMDRQRVGC
jgi:hypothetical protein